MTRLCFGLRNGCPCPRTVMKPLGLCSACRDAPVRVAGPRKSQAAYLKRWRAKRSGAGVSVSMEAAG